MNLQDECPTCGHQMVPSRYLDYLGVECKNCGNFDVRQCPQGISPDDHEDDECYCLPLDTIHGETGI